MAQRATDIPNSPSLSVSIPVSAAATTTTTSSSFTTATSSLYPRSGEDFQLFQDWLTFCHTEDLEPVTLRGYHFNVDKFLWWWHASGNAERLGAHPRNLTVKEAREYASYLKTPTENRWGVAGSKSKLSPATVGNYARPLKVFFNWLEQEGHIEKSPFDRQVKFGTRKGDKTIKHVGTEDLAILFTYLTEPQRLKTYKGCRDLAMIMLLLDSGIRFGELMSIQVAALDLLNFKVKISGKTGTRYALFSEDTKNTLADYLKLRLAQGEKKGPLWFSEDGGPLGHYGAITSIRRVAERSGAKFTPHAMRHTFALLMSRRVSTFELKELLGHSSITTTQIYVQQNIDILGDRYRPHSPLSVLKEQLPGLQNRRRGRPKNTSKSISASDV